jgi:hypothetical protein
VVKLFGFVWHPYYTTKFSVCKEIFTMFKKHSYEGRALILLPSVHEGRAGGMSLFKICKVIGYWQKPIAKLNSSTLKASPSLFKGGGARGWLPIKGAIFAQKQKPPPKR